MKRDTHFSQATPPGRGAMSIIRLSGPMSIESVSVICGKDIQHLMQRKTILTTVYDTKMSPIDTALITFFQQPNSYTGEDVVEISCHGNPYIVDAIVEALLKTGIRLSEPGEFTKDAFLNGKIDLVQAESIGNLISSRSMVAARMRLRILRGDLTESLLKIRSSLVELLSQYEFELDISEDDSFFLMSSKKALSIIVKCLHDCDALLETYDDGVLYNQGFRLAIIGKPNVGKSTLLNRLVGKDRVITSSVPGTTRDTVDAVFFLQDIPITLVDTAGIGSPGDPIEKIGVQRSINEAENCDMIINLLTPKDYKKGFSSNSAPVISVINKIDTLSASQKDQLSKKTKKTLHISALFNTGIAELKDEIYTRTKRPGCDIADIVITTKRQKQAIVHCVEGLKRARGQINKEPPLVELLCIDIKSCISFLDTLLGKTTEDDVLNNIFNNFCVGK